VISYPATATATATTVVNSPLPLLLRSFATDSGGGNGGGKDSNVDAISTPTSTKEAPEIEMEIDIPPPVIDLDSHTNAETDDYDPFEITKSFTDTSYYYPPATDTDPEMLASKYQNLTNEELLDSHTIDPVVDPHTGLEHTFEELVHSPPLRDKNATLPKGTLVGLVVSTKMQKTVNVAVDRYKIHQKYKKRIRYTRKFMAHDEHEVASDGDLVLIVPSQRISKKKHFVLGEILRAKGQL